MKYPSYEKIVELNVLALNLIKVKKSDKAEVRSRQKINEVLKQCMNAPGDVYDKAAVLVKGLVQKHAFASGNRRTAFLAVKYFLLENNQKFGLKDDSSQSKVMLGIREGFYSDNEIREWLKNGKIKEFARS
ncbi:MAG: type II toxin-antitoxin system death-on-curing family toxin [archaeon]|nr:type II toxin-antitoxin system death-on-curing family toxin [archaeon]